MGWFSNMLAGYNADEGQAQLEVMQNRLEEAKIAHKSGLSNEKVVEASKNPETGFVEVEVAPVEGNQPWYTTFTDFFADAGAVIGDKFNEDFPVDPDPETIGTNFTQSAFETADEIIDASGKAVDKIAPSLGNIGLIVAGVAVIFVTSKF